MKKVNLIKNLIFALTGLLSSNVWANADDLLLSPQEMQKLAKFFPAAEENRHLTWEGNALNISLTLNQEKRLVFPAGVTPDLKGALNASQLRLINNHHSLYLTALKPFQAIRLYAAVANVPDVILIDLSAEAAAENKTSNPPENSETTYIEVKGMTRTQTAPLKENTPESENNYSHADNKDNAALEEDAPVSLVRFAWRQLFAPARLVPHSSDIHRVPMRTNAFLPELIYGGKALAHPIAPWSTHQTYVTAVELRNPYRHPTDIQVSRDICGRFQSASLYPRRRLSPAQTLNSDSAVLFLVSAAPFAESLKACHGLSSD